MAISRSRINRGDNLTWPGFVDALAALLMVVIFVLMIFSVAQFYLNQIVREIFEEYRIKNSIEFGINKNYFKKSYDWVNLPYEEKINKIEFKLKQIKKNNFMKDDSFVVQSIDSNFRVNLAVNDEFRLLQLKKNILLETEIKLKELDSTLEVFIDEVLDKNKLRLKNSPQTKLLS